jgi:hypothetical protein
MRAVSGGQNDRWVGRPGRQRVRVPSAQLRDGHLCVTDRLCDLLLLPGKWSLHLNCNGEEEERYSAARPILSSSSKGPLPRFTRELQLQYSGTLKIGVIVGCGILVLLLLTALYFLFFAYMILINMMILWRGMGMDLDINLSRRMDSLFAVLAKHLGTPWVRYLFYPISYTISFFADLDFSALMVDDLQVSCESALGSASLLLGVFIFVLVVIFIQSDYQVFWSTLLQSLLRCTLQKLVRLTPYMTSVTEQLSGYSKYTVILLVSLFINPFQILLRYLMGFLNFSSFFKSRGFLHEGTPACNKVANFEGYDTVLGLISSALFWWLVLPMVFILSHVFVLGCH